ETRMHGHHEIDVISVLIEGQIVHEGSLEHGRSMGAGQAQAQRAGGEGFQHNEINPNAQQNRMLQLWALPETPNEPASYKFYDLVPGEVTRIYGGSKTQSKTLDSQTCIDVGLLADKQSISTDGEFLLYMATGKGEVNGQSVTEGDLVRGDDLRFTANAATQVIVVTKNSATAK
ncbi:Pirin, partial [hydrothermal vent metagenome]